MVWIPTMNAAKRITAAAAAPIRAGNDSSICFFQNACGIYYAASAFYGRINALFDDIFVRHGSLPEQYSEVP